MFEKQVIDLIEDIENLKENLVIEANIPNKPMKDRVEWVMAFFKQFIDEIPMVPRDFAEMAFNVIDWTKIVAHYEEDA